MLADKEREKALSVLLPCVDFAVITKSPNKRAGDWKTLSDLCQKYQVPAKNIEEIDAACQYGLAHLEKDFGKEKGMLLVTGSLYMVADAKVYLDTVLHKYKIGSQVLKYKDKN
jgi:dihydrofolate synthase/folylpolyglutamate synthase